MEHLISGLYLKHQREIESENITEDTKKDILDYIYQKFREEGDDLVEGLYHFYYMLTKYKYNLDEYQTDDQKMAEIFITLADTTAKDCRAYFEFKKYGLIDEFNKNAHKAAHKDLGVSNSDEDMFHIIEEDCDEDNPDDIYISANQLNSTLQDWCRKYAKTPEAVAMFGEWTKEEDESYVFWN